MFQPTNPYNVQKTNAVVQELKTTLNTRRNRLQKGETYYEAIGKNTRRNTSANKQTMQSLRQGRSGTVQSPVLTYKPVTSPLPYVKVAGLSPGVKGLSCKMQDGLYLCAPMQAGGGIRKSRKNRKGNRQRK